MLTDGQASAAEAADKDYKLADANGLYLFVTKSGFKSWRMKYRFGGKEKRLTFGPYPEVSLVEARERRDQARRLLRDQIDPALERQRLRAAGLGGEGVEAGAETELAAQPDLALPTADVPAPTPDAPARNGSVVLPTGVPEAPTPVRPAATASMPIEKPRVPDAPPPRESGPPVRRAAEPTAGPPARPSGRGLVFSSIRPAITLAEQPVRAGLKPTPDPDPDVDEPREAVVEPREAVVHRTPEPSPSVDASRDVPSPRVPAEDEPATAVPFTPEVATGSRALALLRQAEDAVAEARKESRVAKRIAAAALALFLVAALVLGGWFMRQHTAASAPVVAARRAATAGVAAPIHAATPQAPVAAPASPLAAPASIPAVGHPAAASVAAPAAIVPASVAPTPPSLAAVPHRAAHHPAAIGSSGRHHRHRRHRRRGRHHRAQPFPSKATPAAASRHPHAQEITHDVEVTAPRRADAIDPALDRYGRAALCLRAAYSADPGCAALRAAGRQ